MRFKFAGNKLDIAAIVVKNNDTVAIKNGAPVALDFGATTELGCQIKSSNSLAAAEQGNFFGIALGQIAVGAYGEAQVFGYNAFARTILTTRTATNATWASIAAGSIGEYLTINTGTGTAAEAGNQALVRVGTAAMTVAQFARLCETFASTDTQASDTGPQSVTVWTSTRKVFLRAM